MKLTAVVLTYNECDDLTACLDSLRRNAPDVAVTVVDNGSDSQTLDMVASRPYPITYIRNGHNIGVSAARNIGAETVTTPYIVFLDSDTIVTPGALQHMVAYLEDNPQAGVCGCRLTDAAGKVQHSYLPYPGLGRKLRSLLRLNNDPDVATGEYVLGACLMTRTALLHSLAGFDNKLFYGPDDADYCMRVRLAGYTVDYVDDCSVIHGWRRVSHNHIFSTTAIRHVCGLFRLYLKHRRLF